ncbi:condensation domain-containing protein, partial [Kitasatospora sp. CB01950]|uniref:condensation domain-containing protein n=1 Tax=Kitasatospora sp. CB01950 TaxID=1703930 RepID=UPI00095E148C
MIPLSSAQRRLWYLAQLEGPNADYHNRLAVRLTGTLDREALAAALRDVIGRHEVLRTVYPAVDGRPRQQVLAVDELSWEPAVVRVVGAEPATGTLRTLEELWADLSADLPAVEPAADLPGESVTAAELAGAVARAAAHAFELATEIPIRAWLFVVHPEEHVLLLVVHHIAWDEWSTGPLARDLSEAYAARRAGRAPQWEPLPVQYADYTLWQQEVLGDEADPQSLLSTQLAYWKRTLTGSPELLELPFDRPRPPVASHRGHSAVLRIPAGTHRRLAELARERGATLFMVLQAALAVTLHRVGAGADIPIGAPVAGRTDEALDDLIGFFVNTLVVRTDLSGDPTLGEVLDRVRAGTLSALGHHEVPFESLVEALAPARSAAHHPLVQVMLTVQSSTTAAAGLLRAPGLRSDELALGAPSAKFDLNLVLGEAFDADGAPAGLRGVLTAAADLFDPDSAGRLATRLTRVLETLAAQPHTALHAVDVLDSAERRSLLGERHATDWMPTRPTVPQLIAEQAARTPDGVAVIAEDARLTYAELELRAAAHARRLTARGVTPEAVVAVAVPTAELVPALLAVWRAGAVHLVIEPGEPAERITALLAAADHVLTTAESAAALPAHPAVVLLDGPDDPAAGVPAHVPLPDQAARLARSADRPGVLSTHRALVDWLAARQSEHPLRPADRVLQQRPLWADGAAAELWWPLVYGAAAVLVRPDGHRDAPYLAELIRDRAVTVAQLTPTMLELLLHERAVTAGTDLRTVFCAGEALPSPLAERARTTLNARVLPLHAPADAELELTGGPAATTRVHLLDRHLSLVPLGVVGELYVAGPQLPRGLAGCPGPTAERFVASPFEPGARMYRTGDRARRTVDGELVFAGRTDGQARSRGLRIDPAEAEAVLAGHPAVARAAVAVRGGALAGYVTLLPGAERTAEPDLLDFLAARLPEYLVPATVTVLDALPLTPDGRLDRAALPDPAQAAAADRTRESGRAPATAQEEILCEAFAHALGVERVEVEDNFFALGGHSLLAVSLVEYLRARGVSISIRTLLRNPTPAALAGAAGPAPVTVPPNLIPAGAVEITPEMLPLVELDETEIARIAAAVEGGAANIADVYPLAPLQEGIVFHHLMADQDAVDVYAMPIVLAFDSRRRLESFLDAFQVAVDRHDIYRTAIVWEGLREPVQVVLRHARLPVEHVEIDPRGADPVEQLLAAASTRIELNEAPLIRVHTGQEPGTGQWLGLLRIHHLVQDHTTMEVLLGELRELMAG